MTIKKIKSIRTGGQTGIDRAAMDIAREYGIPLCGWCPKNGWAEDYPSAPGLLKDYPELLLGTLPDSIELCIGGPRASECKTAYAFARKMLSDVLLALFSSENELHKNHVHRC